jgi:hypothetical protein
MDANRYRIVQLYDLSAEGIADDTIIDVPVDYTRNTELFAQLHDEVFE